MFMPQGTELEPFDKVSFLDQFEPFSQQLPQGKLVNMPATHCYKQAQSVKDQSLLLAGEALNWFCTILG